MQLKLRGTVLDLTQSPFKDFPELRFKEFPKCHLELERENLKVVRRPASRAVSGRTAARGQGLTRRSRRRTWHAARCSQGYSKLKEQLLSQRDKMIRDRDDLMEDQRKRDEQIMKDHQAEASRRAETRLKDFYRQQTTAARQRDGMGDGGFSPYPEASKHGADDDMKDFEAQYVSLASTAVPHGGAVPLAG